MIDVQDTTQNFEEIQKRSNHLKDQFVLSFQVSTAEIKVTTDLDSSS